MNSENEKRRLLLAPAIVFPAYLFFSYGGWGTVNSYWPVYFNSFDYTNTEIGILSAVGPFAALFGLIFWGTRADRARYRNNVIFLVATILGAISMLYLANDAFLYVLVITIVFMFCFYPLNPMGEAMFLEYAQRGDIRYGKGRIWGSFGLAFLPILPGLAINHWDIRSIFVSYLIFMLLVIGVTSMMPKVQGGQSTSGKKTNLLALRHDKEFVGLIIFLFFFHITIGFYYSFFPVYMDNLGAANLVGANNLAQFAIEIPLVYFGVRLARRFGYANLFLFAFALTAARMLLIGFIDSPALLIVVNLFCGVGYSLVMMMFSFFALRVPTTLRTSAQMMNALLAASIPRFVGSMLGGMLSDIAGIPAVFIGAGVLDIVLIVIFFLWLKKTGSLREPVAMAADRGTR